VLSFIYKLPAFFSYKKENRYNLLHFQKLRFSLNKA